MTDYWWGVVFGLAVGFICGAVAKEQTIENNCQKINRIVLDSKAFECKAVQP